MIRILLQGRTGNNLFQYAVGRALAQRHNTSLILDGAWSNKAHAETFSHLLRLPINATYERKFTILKRLANRFLRIKPEILHAGPVIIDHSDGLVPDLSLASANSLLIGFFQSPILFDSVEQEIRNELDLTKIVIPPESVDFENKLHEQLTVSLHVRRGDYLAIQDTQCLASDYHKKAIEWFRSRHENLRFCVFSDDIPWCKKHFLEEDFVFADLQGSSDDPLHDLRLMAACDHHIIVNSSYSWWGAWLNPSNSKQVVAPEMWMKNFSSKNIIPNTWTSL
ncbi:alpha-1,2-fucosyltransferase [Luteolibacter algae]|uniref:Alpha-1,2-fucosyltransferase n=1 Tax=Luteolibacter algae TaxID=454151 RepID=A0ABW5D5M8_9BACT